MSSSMPDLPPELFSGIGAALSIFLSSVGACWASVPSGVYATHSGNEGVRGFAAIIISGVLAIYGIIVSAVIVGRMNASAELTSIDGYKHLSAGLAVGLACLASGGGMAGFVDRHMNTSLKLQAVSTGASRDTENEQMTPLIPSISSEPLVFETTGKFLMVLVFIEAVALYGLIIALLLVGSVL
jgi:ATP synthase proteolipid subunit